MIINHNLGALNANRQMGINASNASKSMEKLSSGLRINKAGDDAAGLAISEKMRGQIRGLDQAAANSQSAISLLQTGEGALNETTSILQRMRELAVQGSNDTLNANDRGQIQKEMDQLVAETDRIGNNTEFNTKKLLNGAANVSGTSSTTNAAITGGTGDTQIGAQVIITGSTLATAATATRAGAFTASVTTGAVAININGTSFNFATGTTNIDAAKAINDAGVGVTATFTATDLILTTSAVGSAATLKSDAVAAGTIATNTGADATATITGTPNYTAVGNTITIQQPGAAKGLEITLKAAGAATLDVAANGTLSFQIGANQGQLLNVGIADMRSAALGTAGVKVTDSSTATTAITTIQTAIDKVSSERSKLGAFSNRLEHTIANLGTASENMTSAESRIRDVDMAKEMSTFSKNNILSQAAQAMLAQANQQPQQVLQLLR